MAIEAYRTQALTTAEVGRLLGFESRWEVEAFLSRGRVPLDYGEADLAKDVASIRTARGR